MPNQEESIYQIVPIPGSGVGVTATTQISRGDLILSEAPLITLENALVDTESAIGIITGEFSVASSVRMLSKDDQRSFLSLYNCHKQRLPPFLGTFKTNCISLGVGATKAGIFLKCSRFNHSCIPNAMYSWNSKISREIIYALKDISPGQQITVSYLGKESQLSRSSRQLNLLTSWHFECLCEACAKPTKEIEASDRRRRNIALMDEIVGVGAFMRSNPSKALGFCWQILKLWDEEGLYELPLYRTYYDAFQVCVMHGDLARASAFASLALKVGEDCEGKENHDASKFERIKGFIERPESHPIARTTEMWRSSVKDRRDIGSNGFERWLWSRAG